MTKPWEQFRKEIIRLYIREGRTLQEVQRIMKAKHKFDASIRSYRQWFDKWNVTKYNCKKRQQRRRLSQGGMMQQQQYPKQEAHDELYGPTLNSSLPCVKGEAIAIQDSPAKAQKPQDLIAGAANPPSPKVEVKQETSYDCPLAVAYGKGQAIVIQDSLADAQKPQDLVAGATNSSSSSSSPSPKAEVKQRTNYDHSLAYARRPSIVTTDSLTSDREPQDLITGAASNLPSPKAETKPENFNCSPQAESPWSKFSSPQSQNICQGGAFAPEIPRQDHHLITGASSNLPSPEAEASPEYHPWSKFGSSRSQNICCQGGAFAPEIPRYQGPEYFYDSTPRYSEPAVAFTLTDKHSFYHEDRGSPSWGILSPPEMDYDLGVGQDVSFMR